MFCYYESCTWRIKVSVNKLIFLCSWQVHGKIISNKRLLAWLIKKKIITPHLLKIALQQSGNHTNVKMVQIDQFVKRLCIGSNLQSKISVCRITQISAFQTFFYLTFVLYVILNVHSASNYIVCSNK